MNQNLWYFVPVGDSNGSTKIQDLLLKEPYIICEWPHGVCCLDIAGMGWKSQPEKTESNFRSIKVCRWGEVVGLLKTNHDTLQGFASQGPIHDGCWLKG